MIFPTFEGQIVDRGDYLVIRTPSNPTFYWGNYLLFARPPQAGDFERWRALFATEIGVPPGVEHQTFGWDSPDGDQGVIEPFIQAGFEANHDVIMTSAEVRPPGRPSSGIDILPLQTDAEWAEAVELQVTCREPFFEEAAHRVFRLKMMDRYRRMAQAGLGNWYGAFIGGRMVADLGVFHDRVLGRYQSVETHPDFRRQGIAGSMIYMAGREEMARHHLQTLVMIAEEGAAPARLYRSLGFEPVEKSVGLLWFPHAEQPRSSTG